MVNVRSFAIKAQPLIVFVPLFAELTRKYVIQSAQVFSGVHIALFALSLKYLLSAHKDKLAKFAIFAIPLVVWCLFHSIIQPVSPILLAIGISTYLIPVFATAICIGVTARADQRLLYRIASIFQLTGAILGAVQIGLGADHLVNFVPAATDPGYAHFGSDVPESLAGIFRPFSFYMHVGKFGQIAFILFVFRAFYNLRNNPEKFMASFIIFDLPALVISSQRAAFIVVVLFFCLIVLRSLTNRSGPKKAAFVTPKYWSATLAFFVLVAIGVSFVSPIVSDFAILTGQRFISVFDETARRGSDNLVNPLSNFEDRYLFFGDGVGRYSFGAQRLLAEGDQSNDFLFTRTENSWLRTIAELGVVGAIAYAFLLMGIVIQARRVAGTWFNETAFFVLSLSLWANTHDVFMNFVGMWLGFMLLGSPPIGQEFVEHGTMRTRPRSRKKDPTVIRRHPFGRLTVRPQPFGRGRRIGSCDKG